MRVHASNISSAEFCTSCSIAYKFQVSHMRASLILTKTMRNFLYFMCPPFHLFSHSLVPHTKRTLIWVTSTTLFCSAPSILSLSQSADTNAVAIVVAWMWMLSLSYYANGGASGGSVGFIKNGGGEDTNGPTSKRWIKYSIRTKETLREDCV